MYRYSLLPFIKNKHRSYGRYGKKQLKWGYAQTLCPKSKDYQVMLTYLSFLDVVVYSKTRLTQVPARNGVLVPATLYLEEKLQEEIKKNGN